jgi:futalosine hydrolase
VECVGVEGLRAATRGCEVVLLVATAGEAAPLLRALEDLHTVEVATKQVSIGTLAAPGPAAGAGRNLALGAAQAREAGRRVAVAISGCDKTNTAHLLTCLLQAMDPRPRLVLQVGIAGALPGPDGEARARVGDVVLATQEAYSDTGSSSPDGWLSARDLGLPIAAAGGVESGGVFPVAERLATRALQLLVAAADAAAAGAEAQQGGTSTSNLAERPRVHAGPCITASEMTGLSTEAAELARRWGALAESMEGAAGAHVCSLYQTPFLEVRGISNLVVDRARETWEVDRALEAASWAALALVDALDRLPLAGVEAAEVPAEGG